MQVSVYLKLLRSLMNAHNGIEISAAEYSMPIDRCVRRNGMGGTSATRGGGRGGAADAHASGPYILPGAGTSRPSRTLRTRCASRWRCRTGSTTSCGRRTSLG
jgi:hypothetical protein